MEGLELLRGELWTSIDALQRARELHTGIDLPHLQSFEALGGKFDLQTLRFVASAVGEIAPRHVIEFGSGPSTELLGLLGLAHGRMAITTFEHDPWAARELLAVSNPFAINYRWFSFCLCPLIVRRCRGVPLPVYDDGMTVPAVPFPADLILIQGPPQTLGGRGGMIDQALKYARAGTIVLLLHVQRDEAAMVESWSNDLSSHIQFVPPGLLDCHLAFVVREPLRAPFTLEAPHAQDAFAAEAARITVAD